MKIVGDLSRSEVKFFDDNGVEMNLRVRRMWIAAAPGGVASVTLTMYDAQIDLKVRNDDVVMEVAPEPEKPSGQ